MIKRLGILGFVVLALNTIGFAGYLLWLVSGSDHIFYTQDGVLFLLPCVPFFFVYLYLFHNRKPPDEGADGKGGTHHG